MENCDNLVIEHSGLVVLPPSDGRRYKQTIFRLANQQVLIKSKETKAELPIGKELMRTGGFVIIAMPLDEIM